MKLKVDIEQLATRDLEILRGVEEDVAEEAKTRGLPSPPFDSFGLFI